MYADDLTLLCPSAKGLQILIDICASYAKEFDIIFNTEKSGCLYFESKTFKLLSVPSVKLGGRVIEFKDHQKILGCFIDRCGSDEQDMSRQVRGIYARANMLTRKFSMCTYDVKRRLFLAYCTNFYCAHLWSDFSRSQLQRVRVAYNNAFRRFFRLPTRCSISEAFIRNNVPTFEMLLRKYTFSLEQRLSRSQNVLLRTIFNCDLQFTNELRIRWISVLRH